MEHAVSEFINETWGHLNRKDGMTWFTTAMCLFTGNLAPHAGVYHGKVELSRPHLPGAGARVLDSRSRVASLVFFLCLVTVGLVVLRQSGGLFPVPGDRGCGGLSSMYLVESLFWRDVPGYIHTWRRGGSQSVASIFGTSLELPRKIGIMAVRASAFGPHYDAWRVKPVLNLEAITVTQ